MNQEKVKLKRLVKYLDRSRGIGSSVVSLLMPPGTQLHKSNQMLTEELSNAENIKSRVNRQAVTSAIASTQQRLKSYNTCPPNGLVIYAGEVADNEGKPKKITLSFEPHRPLATSLFRCDDTFYTDALKELLIDDDAYGFVVIGGGTLLIATVRGDQKDIQMKWEVDLPKKHNKGGQSAQRFGRIFMEKRQNFLTKVGEYVTQAFITDAKPNVKGIVLAGCAEFKDKFYDSSTFDPRLKACVIGVLDIAYGMENGLNEALHKAEGMLDSVQLVQEKKAVDRLFDEITMDTGKYLFGQKEVLEALEQGLIEELLIYSESAATRQNEAGEVESLLDWLLEHQSDLSTKLSLISDRTPQGMQFISGFGGIAGILRYKMAPVEVAEEVVAPEEEKGPRTYLEEEYDFI